MNVHGALVWLVVPAVLAAAFLLGPRVRTGAQYRQPDLPPDVGAYVAESERRFPDIAPGTEKKIVWRKEGERTPVALVFLHGFSGSRQDISPVMERVAERLDANLYLNRYAGHGRGPEEMGRPKLQDWADDTAEAIAIGKRLGEKVVVVALSTGAPLAAWACTRTADVSALVMISPNFGPANTSSEPLLLPWGPVLLKLFTGDYYGGPAADELHARFTTPRFRSEALLTMMAAVSLGRKTKLERISVPVLCLYSERDDTISLPRMREAFGRIGSADKAIAEVPGARGHVVAGDINSPGTTDAVTETLAGWIGERLR